MKTVSKTITGAIAAALLTTAVASPAQARDYYGRRDHGGISLGDVVVGAIAVAGVATVAAALSSRNRHDRGYGYDDRGYDNGRDASRYGNDQRASIDACTYEAQREAGRRFGSSARVSNIDNVDRNRDGYQVRGTVEVQSRYNDGYGNRGYGNGGYGRDRYYDRYSRGTERVAFSCSARYGQVTDLRIGSSYAQGY